MSRIAIVGGHGQIAVLLIGVLVERGHHPVALVRTEDYRAELVALGAEFAMLDIENADTAAFARAFEDCDAIVFAAGGGPDGNVERKRTVDLDGSVKSADAALAVGIRRFIQISAIGVDEPLAADVGEVWRAYVEAKRDADAHLRETDLDWTVIRPGSLSDDPGTGLITLAEKVERGEIPRADVAAVIAHCIDDDASIGRQWELVRGETRLAEAIAAESA